MAVNTISPFTSLIFNDNVERALTFKNGGRQKKKMVLIRASSSTDLMMKESSSSLLISSAPPLKKSEKRGNFGFKNLAETFWVDVQKAEGRALNLNVGLGGSIDENKVQNVAIRVELKNGCVGWGEVSASDQNDHQSVALDKVNEACEFLSCSSPKVLDLVLHQLSGFLPGTQFASVRAGVEMAIIDAVANSIDVPLWRLFGGVSNTLSTSITLPTVYPPVEICELASKYSQLGFKTFKVKIGKNMGSQIKTLKSIQSAYPHISFILDASEGYTPHEAIQLLQSLHGSGITVAVLEQPVDREDWEGLREVSNFAKKQYGISIGVDESCESLSDVTRLINEKSAHVINLKLSKFGVMGSLQIVDLATKSGLNLMISSSVETRLATGFAAQFAAGLGSFNYVGLDMPFMLSEDPVICGCEVSGPGYKFSNARGQGGFLKWEF